MAVQLNTQKRGDGFVYPETGRSVEGDFLYQLPYSHTVEHADREPLDDSFRRSVGGLIIHMLGLLYQSRCQFWNWWAEGRLKVGDSKIAWFTDEDTSVSTILVTALKSWNSWPAEARRMYVNSLWHHSRIASYHWDWERFLMAFVVTDSLWALVRRVKSVAKPKRRASMRKLSGIEILANHYGIIDHPEFLRLFVRLRNDFFHQALWDRGHLGDPGSYDAFLAEIRLRRFNERLLLAIAGVECKFIHTDWLSLSPTELGTVTERRAGPG